MAVRPAGGNGVRTDQVDIDQPGLFRGQRWCGVEPAGHPGLASAIRARTEPAQADRAVDGPMQIGPIDFERPGRSIRVNPDRDGLVAGWEGLHAPIVPCPREACQQPGRRSHGAGAGRTHDPSARAIRPAIAGIGRSGPSKGSGGPDVGDLIMRDHGLVTELDQSTGRATNAHVHSVEDVAAMLGVDPDRGLDGADVDQRARRFGTNELEPARRESIATMLVESATEPFVLVLAAAGLLAIALGEVRDGLLIVIALLPIVGADVVTEFRAERALDALREASAPTARVRRDGAALDVAASGLVPGDVVLLRVGDIVPADLRIVSTDRLLVDRSAITGESIPESVQVAPDLPEAVLADRRTMAYAGTSVVGGSGVGLVVSTGATSEIGRIAGGLQERIVRRSPLQHELDRLVRIMLVVAIALIAIVAGLGFIRGQTLGENLLAGISAAIAAIPEEPPVLLAVILGLGSYRLLKRGVLVRRLNAEEVLGAISLIITDKTGTLTLNRLEVASVRSTDGPVTDRSERLGVLEEALRAESDAWAIGAGLRPGAFTKSLLRALEAEGVDRHLDRDDLISTDPPSSSRPVSITVARLGETIQRLATGAPEAVLAMDGASDRDVLAAWDAQIALGAGAGERLIGLAAARDGEPWVMRGLIGFADPLRDGIGPALREAEGAGIQTIVVTGDHPATAAAIARAAGLGDERIVSGAEIAAWDDAHLARELPSIQVVARSTPEQKERLVRVARAAGHIVAVTGDGVNDAPALHNADVAVAMGSGTAVAREAADLVLGDDSFVTLMFGLREGRRLVDNIQKGLVFLLSTHLAFLGFVLLATIAGHGQPLLPIQILWMELFIDTSTSIAFERERGEPDVMQRPPRRTGIPLLPASLLLRIALAGGFSALAALWLLQTQAGSPDHVRWLAFTALVFGQVVRAYANRTLRTPVFRISANRLLLVGGATVILIQALIPFVPGLADAFRASHLDPGEWLLVAFVALAPALLAEFIRWRGRMVWVA